MNDNIINLFHKSKLSKYALAHRSGVPYTTVNEILNAKIDINRCASETVCRLAAILHADPAAVLNDIHILDGISGKHCGVRYTLRYNGTSMEILFRYKDEDIVLETGHAYRIPERRDDYITFLEWRIEDYLASHSFDEYAKEQFEETA